MKIFKNTPFFCMQEKGEDMWAVLERRRELQLFLWSFKLLYGSHFVFFPAVPNMELQSWELHKSVHNVGGLKRQKDRLIHPSVVLKIQYKF